MILMLGMPSAAQAQDIVATVNGEAVETQSFQEQYKQYLASTGMQDAPRLRRAVLAQIINDRLIIADGRRQGLDHTAECRHFKESARRKLLVESYLAEHVMNPVDVTDEDVEDAFIRINTEIEARHLFAHSEEEAVRLHERLLAGETFEDLAREAFGDPALAESGGLVGRFTFDELDPDFEDAAFALRVGEVSEPVRTVHGYSIIQVIDRFTKPILTELEFAQRKEKLRAFVRRKKQVQARSHFVRSEVESLRLTFHSGFARLFGQITGVVLVSDEAMDEFMLEPLVSFARDGGQSTWMIDDFRDHAAFTPAEQRAQVRTEDDLRRFVAALVVRVGMMETAERSGLEERPEFARALAAATDEWLLERKKERLVEGVTVPEDSIRAHHERHPTEFTDDSGVPATFDEVRSRIADQLHRAYTRDATMSYVASLRRSAEIDIDEEALRAAARPRRASSSVGGGSMRSAGDRSHRPSGDRRNRSVGDDPAHPAGDPAEGMH